MWGRVSNDANFVEMGGRQVRSILKVRSLFSIDSEWNGKERERRPCGTHPGTETIGSEVADISRVVRVSRRRTRRLGDSY